MLFLVLVSVFSVCFSTTVVINNGCDRAISVVYTMNDVDPVPFCSLEPGTSCTSSHDSESGNFKEGSEGKTLAEFTFNNEDGEDYYDLSVVDGFDTPIQISTDKDGPTVTCGEPGCVDAYLDPHDDTKVHNVETGGTFTVNFCP